MIHDILDLHTHTIMSGHAYSTMQEMIRSAIRNMTHAATTHIRTRKARTQRSGQSLLSRWKTRLY